MTYLNSKGVKNGKMIQNIFDLDDTTVEEIMTPRPDIIALESNRTVEEVINEIIGKYLSVVKDTGNQNVILFSITFPLKS